MRYSRIIPAFSQGFLLSSQQEAGRPGMSLTKALPVPHLHEPTHFLKYPNPTTGLSYVYFATCACVNFVYFSATYTRFSIQVSVVIVKLPSPLLYQPAASTVGPWCDVAFSSSDPRWRQGRISGGEGRAEGWSPPWHNNNNNNNIKYDSVYGAVIMT